MYFYCENITKSYQYQPVVEDISLGVGQNELVSLLGVSGVGKTTLFHVLAGVNRPDSGRVVLDNEEITGIPGKSGYMLQKDLLLPHKTILDNVCLPLSIKGVPRKQAHEQAQLFFDQFGLKNCEKKYPYQLSGGMRQRAALLRTHLTGAGLMLLDEPFSALDAITKIQMHEWYLEIMEQIPRSTLFITHDIDEALMLSDRIYIMSGSPGHIITELNVNTKRPRHTDFMISGEFMNTKREILNSIGINKM